jgi:hypothetical protein
MKPLKRFLPLFLLINFTLLSCASRAPSLIRFATEEGATQYYFPIMVWKQESGNIKAECDFTYRYQTGSDAVCNISFIFEKGNEGAFPGFPASASFEAGGKQYSLRGISSLFSDGQRKTQRITSTLPGEEFLELIKNDELALNASIDGTEYRFIAPKKFFPYRNEALSSMNGQEIK